MELSACLCDGRFGRRPESEVCRSLKSKQIAGAGPRDRESFSLGIVIVSETRGALGYRDSKADWEGEEELRGKPFCLK